MKALKKVSSVLGVAFLTLAFTGCAISKDSRLIVAAEKGDTQKVRVLIAQGADPNATDSEGFNAYLAASTNGQTETMHYLKSIGAQDNPGF